MEGAQDVAAQLDRYVVWYLATDHPFRCRGLDVDFDVDFDVDLVVVVNLDGDDDVDGDGPR
jgi:hypothetical protein